MGDDEDSAGHLNSGQRPIDRLPDAETARNAII